MAGKSLNKANLTALGADVLADLLLEALKDKATAASEVPITAADLARHDYVRKADRESRARQSRNSTLERILQEVADQQGDVDGWMAKYTPEQLTYHTIAPDAATRLLEAGRPEEALALIRTAIATQDLLLAQQLIDTRHADLDGNVYEILTPLAEDLAANHPLQAVLLWRALIDFALSQQRKGATATLPVISKAAQRPTRGSATMATTARTPAI